VEWFVEKGYGFIKPEEHGRDNVFAHISQVSQKKPMARGAAVSYRSKFDAVKKSDTASHVELRPAHHPKTQQRSNSGNNSNNNQRMPYNELDASHSYNNTSKTTYVPGAINTTAVRAERRRTAFFNTFIIDTRSLCESTWLTIRKPSTNISLLRLHLRVL